MIDILKSVKTIGVGVLSKVKQASPEILLGLGTATIVTGIIFACKKTKKAEEVLDEHLKTRETIDKIEVGTKIEHEGTELVYTKKDRSKDLTTLYFNTTKELVKVYALPSGLIFAGFGMIFSGFGILKHRNAQLLAASTAIAEAFKEYKEKVKEAIGSEKEKDIRFNAKEETVEEEKEDKDGKKKKTKKKIKTYSDLANDPYARCFDEFNPNWKNDNNQNKTFLLIAQNWANDLYNARGHVFLNEVYDLLGFDHTSTGAVSGWVKGKGDDYISFGIEDGVMEANRAFNRGEEPSIWLDFNVDGVILDYIGG